MDWKVQNLNAVLFTEPASGLASAFETWKALIGKNPSQTNEQTDPMPTSQASGPVACGSFSVTYQVGRVDLKLNPDQQQSIQTGPALPILDDLDEALHFLTGRIQVVAASINPFRVALVVNLMKPAADAQEAARIFSEETNISDIPAGASDLTFGLNVRKKIGSAGWELNRLRTWGVGQIQWMQFQVGGAAHVPIPATVQHLATSMIDLNTVPRGIALGPKQAISAFDDLAVELKSAISGGYGYLASNS